MLPSKGYFKGVKCPDQSKGGCHRPFCHFRHETRPETDITAGTSSASVIENTEIKSTSNSNQRPKDVDEVTASTSSSSSSDMKCKSSAVENISSKIAVSDVNKCTSTMAIQPEMIQQLVNAAVQRVIADNPALAAGPVDTAAIMQSIDTSAIVAQATQSIAAKVVTSTDQTNNDDMIDSTNTDQTLKTKKKLYLRPPNAPAYNPTPIKELEKRKLVIDDKGSNNKNLNPIRSRLLDDVMESESNSKGSGVESELTDFSASSEDEEDREKRRSEFDILEEVLAEHSANNKNKVKKKKKKALGKLQYSNSPTKFIDESSLISDARDVCENDFSIDIDKTPKRKSKMAVKDKTDESDPTSYFLPPSPVFTGASCDGYSNSGTVYTDPYSSNNLSMTNFIGSYNKEDKTDSENDEFVINESTTDNIESNNDSTAISNDKLPVSSQSKQKDKPRQGHALLCQLVQNPIPVTKLSRQNVSAWLPGAKKNASVAETDSTSGDLLEAMVSNFDGGVSRMPILSTDKEDLDQSSKDDLMPSKFAESKSYKVDLNKEILSLDKQKELKILTKEDKEYLPKDSEYESNDKTEKVQVNENKNSSTKVDCDENKFQELIVESNAKKSKEGFKDFSGSESEKESNENIDSNKKIKSDRNKNKKEKHKKSHNKKDNNRSHSESEFDDESDASAGKKKKKYKKKKKRSRRKSDSEEESSEEECSDKDVDNDSKHKTSEIKRNEKKASSKDKSKGKIIQDLSADLNDKSNNKECKDLSESDSERENHENKKSDKSLKSGEKINKKERHKKSHNKKKKHRSRSDSESYEDSDASAGKEKKKHKKKKKRRSRKKTDSEEENSNEESLDKAQEKKGRKLKKKKCYDTDISDANTDKESTDKKVKSRSIERKNEKDKKLKGKDDKLNSDEEKSDKDQEKEGRKQKKRKGINTDESEANTDKENTDNKCKSKSVERDKEKDERDESVKEKNNKNHSDSENDKNKDEIDNNKNSNKSLEKVSKRSSRSRDKKSEDYCTDAIKVEPKDGLEERDKGKTIDQENKKRKRSSSSEKSSSRHRSSSRKSKKKRRGSKHKKKRGRKHKKRKYSRSDSEESDDDYTDEEESDEESGSSEEKENKSKEKGKRYKTSKYHKKSSKHKKKGRYRRNRSSSESSSSSSHSRSKSRSKSKEKKRKERQSKEAKKKSTEISIPMPVDPSKIKEEKIDYIDLTKVKIEKLDDETLNLELNIKKTSTDSMQLSCTKNIKEEKNSDNEGEKEIIDQQNERLNQISIANKTAEKGNQKLSETKSSNEVDPVTRKRVLDKEDGCISAKVIGKSVDVRRGSGEKSKDKNKDKEDSYSKSKPNDRIEINKSKDMVVKESESSISNKHKVDLDKEIEKLSSKSSMPENLSSDIVKSNKISNECDAQAPKESDKPAPPSMSIFDMVLASTVVTPTKKVLKEVSMFDTVAASNNDFPSPPSSPEHSPGNSPEKTPVHSPRRSPGHLPDSPSFDYNSKFTDPPGTFSFDGIKRRKSSCDEKDTSKEKKRDKDNVKLKDKKEGNQKEERNKESKTSKTEHTKDTQSTDKERQSKSKDDHRKEHRISSSSNSHRSGKEESKHSTSRSSSKHKESSHSNSSKSSSSSHTKKKDDSKSHSSNSKHKSDKETDGKSSKHSSNRTSHHSSSSSSHHTSTSSSHHTSSSSSHSSKKHSSSSSKSSSSSSKKNSSSSSKRKEMLFDDLLNTPTKKLKTEKGKSHSDQGVNKNLDSDDGGDSPMPDLSALDDIADDDWNQIINPDKSQTYDEYSHLENLRSDESDEDELADLDDPRVMEECKQMFADYEPPPGETIHHSKPKERKMPKESLKVEIPAGKQRIARAPSSGSSTGNLIQKPVHRKPKMTPTQMMMERYKKLKEKAEELNKLVKTQEAQLKKQQVKSEPSDYPSKVESKHSGLSSAILSNKPSGKPRIAHVPNVSGLLQARDKIKSLPPTNSRSLLSAQASKASGSVPAHTAAMTSTKGAKRVAHTPAPETFSRPIVPVEFGSKVPQNVRQRYLNTFIDECLKFCEGQAEAFSKAMAEEKVCFNRATSRSIYLNLAVNTIKRLRMKQISEEAEELLLNDPQYSQDNFENQPSTSSGRSSKSKLSHPPTHKPSPMSHPTNPNLRSQSHFTTIATGGTKGSWSIEKVRRTNSEVEKLKGLALYKHLKAYILSEEDLETNGYPRTDPDEKGKAIIKVAAHRKKISPSSTERYCDRCKISFVVDKWGFPTSTEPCRHHWGRIYKKRGPGGLQSVYSCCSGDLTAEGCNIASTHVSQNFNPKELRGYVRTLPKGSKDGNFGIYALDCEMCYTTSGNELTRVTIIDAEGNMVYDTLVKPDNPIIDYNTRFSGITEEDMESVTTTIREVQTSCLTRFNDRTILIGHSLESDLHALKIIHDTVIDTSVVFPHKMGPPYKRALRNLASELLKRIIQEDVSGHDSKEDAAAAMDLMHWKVKEDLKMK